MVIRIFLIEEDTVVTIYLFYFNKNMGIKYKAYRFGTYGFSSLIWLYKLFYTHDKIKIVPKNIADLLTPLALAILITFSGKFINGKVELSTEFFREKDLNKLIYVLENYLGLVCNINKIKKNYYVVTIPKKYIKSLQAIVSSYYIPDLKYKIGLQVKLYYNKAISNSTDKRFIPLLMDLMTQIIYFLQS